MENLHQQTIPEIFKARAVHYGSKACVAYKDQKEGRYRDISWADMDAKVSALARYLLSRGVKKGDRVAVFSANRPEWWMADLAILSVGAVNVPVYATNSAEEARYILDHSGSRLCFAGDSEQAQKVLSVMKALPELEELVIFDDPEGKDGRLRSFREVLAEGDAWEDSGALEARRKAVTLGDMATIIYTSGTTGDPKGVMLSHGNFSSNLHQQYSEMKEYLHDRQVMLSILPLSHAFERTCGYYLPMAVGAKVAFSEDTAKLMQNFLEVKPTVILSVPRVFEKIHSAIASKVHEAPGLKKAIFRAAMKTAGKNLPYVCGNRPRRGLFARRYKLFDGMVYSKLKTALGMDNIDIAVSGGGPLSVSDAEFFLGMDIRVLEGYGLTETTPALTINRPWRIKPGSVGAAYPLTDIVLSDEGEVLVRGPQVMMGYYKNQKATDEVFTKDGFFKTGDLGRVDDDGYLFITGRIKDIIITAGGKNISPQNIENSLKGSRFIEQVAIIGDKRKYLAALVIPCFEELRKWASRSGVDFRDDADLVRNERVIALFRKEIDEQTRQFSRVEQVRTFRLIDAEWTQATGELTPTLKVKRRVIEEKYAGEIESLYASD